MEGILDDSLAEQLQGEMTSFRDSLRDLIGKVEQLSADEESKSTALVPQTEAEDAKLKRKRDLYQKLISVVLSETDNQKLANAWMTVQNLLEKPEVADIFIKLTENKDDFMKMMECVQDH